MNGGVRGVVRILLFSEVILFEYKCLNNFVADCGCRLYTYSFWQRLLFSQENFLFKITRVMPM